MLIVLSSAFPSTAPSRCRPVAISMAAIPIWFYRRLFGRRLGRLGTARGRGCGLWHHCGGRNTAVILRMVATATATRRAHAFLIRTHLDLLKGTCSMSREKHKRIQDAHIEMDQTAARACDIDLAVRFLGLAPSGYCPTCVDIAVRWLKYSRRPAGSAGWRADPAHKGGEEGFAA